MTHSSYCTVQYETDSFRQAQICLYPPLKIRMAKFCLLRNFNLTQKCHVGNFRNKCALWFNKTLECSEMFKLFNWAFKRIKASKRSSTRFILNFKVKAYRFSLIITFSQCNFIFYHDSVLQNTLLLMKMSQKEGEVLEAVENEQEGNDL